MLSGVFSVAKGALGLSSVIFGIKPLKYFIDSVIRDKVAPVPGSVLYCDLWVAAEHSGIYVDDNLISNIVVEGVAESAVRLSSPESFTSKSTLGRKIYVSCDSTGAVGNRLVAEAADAEVGERAFYGLVIKNCHQFSTRCVNRSDQDFRLAGILSAFVHTETWEPTLSILKRAAGQKLGTTKWRLWDWDQDIERNPPAEPDWNQHSSHFQNIPLNPQSMAQLRAELEATQAYEAEIADENIPSHIRHRLSGFRQVLADVSQTYEEAKDFIASCPDANFSYNDLKSANEDFAALARTLQNSAPIRDLAHKMGRQYISEHKKQNRIAQASKSEVHGTHRSDDLMRMLPSELLNLEDDTLETLFYARLLEKNLLSYELKGTAHTVAEEAEKASKRTGPVVACLDTSGSMQGQPLQKAKALLLAIANMLKKEDRSLHVLLFGATGELREFSMDRRNDAAGLLCFLNQGFGGGTDFETPLKHAFEIIGANGNYLKADVLMISDGDCQLSPEFSAQLNAHKTRLECSIYTVLCAGSRTEDSFSDEVVLL